MGFRSDSETVTEAFQPSSRRGSAVRRCGPAEAPRAPTAAISDTESSRETPSRAIVGRPTAQDKAGGLWGALGAARRR